MRISRSIASAGRQDNHPAVYFTAIHSSREELEIVPNSVHPGVADRIKVFEDLIRAAGQPQTALVRPPRSRSCPARPCPPVAQPAAGSKIRLGSNLSLFGGSNSSGYTSASPTSSEVEERGRFAATSSRSPPVDHDDDDEEKRIAREIFSARDHQQMDAGLLFSSASTDEEDEGIRWSDLEADTAPKQFAKDNKVVALLGCVACCVCLTKSPRNWSTRLLLPPGSILILVL